MHIPRCQWFPLGKCRKGSACRKLHDVSGEVPDSAHLAKVSRCRDASDRDFLVLRPLLEVVIPKFFRGTNKPVTLGTWSQWKLDGMHMLTFELENMNPPDDVACSAAKTAGWVWKDDLRFQGNHKEQSSSTSFGDVVFHGTSLNNCLLYTSDAADE